MNGWKRGVGCEGGEAAKTENGERWMGRRGRAHGGGSGLSVGVSEAGSPGLTRRRVGAAQTDEGHSRYVRWRNQQCR